MWNTDIEFWNNITPLNRTNMMKLVENLNFLYSRIANLITNPEGEVETPLPTASGDGIIRYVVTVTKDMIWTSSTPPSGGNLVEGGRYFVAILENEQTYKYHLEIWYYTDGDWWTDPNYDETDTSNVYTDRCWDRCTHDKLYTCQNTNKCYYMNNSAGTAIIGHAVNPGTTKESRDFMTETAEAARTIWSAAGSSARSGWAGIERDLLLRYKVVIINFTCQTTGEEIEGNSPLMSTAFNPWYVHKQCVFAPFVKPYGNWDLNMSPTITGYSTGMVRIMDGKPISQGGDGKFHFGAFLDDKVWYDIYISTIIGVADVTVDSN